MQRNVSSALLQSCSGELMVEGEIPDVGSVDSYDMVSSEPRSHVARETKEETETGTLRERERASLEDEAEIDRQRHKAAEARKPGGAKQ